VEVIVILGDLEYQFRNEGPLRYGTNINNIGGKRKHDYSDADIVSFKYDVANGAKIIDAAKEHGIPLSSARALIPKVKRPKNKPLALEMLKKKISGEIDCSYAHIARESGYTRPGISRIKNEEL
tara:strand:- start:188 stop:559 length:372 start_codon:yes stop_codon:yes gene_type:complete